MSTARMEQFSGYMRSVTTSEGVDVKHLITGYGWANLGDATVVDVRKQIYPFLISQSRRRVAIAALTATTGGRINWLC